jgi:hypothetical protein
MTIGLQVLEALLAGAIGSGLFWLLGGGVGWRQWGAVALPYALLVYLILFGAVRLG